ncbi:MAG: hypothetical protein M3163_08745, partial [Actinomycetota bacterium]|nr:hypothetical protein [Actinomycetota bacterium]
MPSASTTGTWRLRVRVIWANTVSSESSGEHTGTGLDITATTLISSMSGPCRVRPRTMSRSESTPS